MDGWIDGWRGGWREGGMDSWIDGGCTMYMYMIILQVCRYSHIHTTIYYIQRCGNSEPTARHFDTTLVLLPTYFVHSSVLNWLDHFHTTEIHTIYLVYVVLLLCITCLTSSSSNDWKFFRNLCEWNITYLILANTIQYTCTHVHV